MSRYAMAVQCLHTMRRTTVCSAAMLANVASRTRDLAATSRSPRFRSLLSCVEWSVPCSLVGAACGVALYLGLCGWNSAAVWFGLLYVVSSTTSCRQVSCDARAWQP